MGFLNNYKKSQYWMLAKKEILCCIRFKKALGQSEGYKQLVSYQICWLEIVEIFKYIRNQFQFAPDLRSRGDVHDVR